MQVPPSSLTQVYPRPRGGAGRYTPAPRPCGGLSPPTRGSLQFGHSGQVWHRSIPAHAGEPVTVPEARRPYTVYPRPRGGAGLRA